MIAEIYKSHTIHQNESHSLKIWLFENDEGNAYQLPCGLIHTYKQI